MPRRAERTTEHGTLAMCDTNLAAAGGGTHASCRDRRCRAARLRLADEFSLERSPRPLKPAAQLRDAAGGDAKPVGDGERGFTRREPVDDPAVAAAERSQPVLEIQVEHGLRRGRDPVVLQHRPPPIPRLASARCQAGHRETMTSAGQWAEDIATALPAARPTVHRVTVPAAPSGRTRSRP